MSQKKTKTKEKEEREAAAIPCSFLACPKLGFVFKGGNHCGLSKLCPLAIRDLWTVWGVVNSRWEAKPQVLCFGNNPSVCGENWQVRGLFWFPLAEADFA